MALTFDDLLNVDSKIDLQFDFESADCQFDFSNMSNNIVKADSSKPSKCKKSPFHESDSGVSEDFNSVGSPTEAGTMLDDLVDSLDFEPFCQGSDKDLVDYFGVSSPETDIVSPSNLDVENDSEISRPSSPEVEKSSRGRRTRSKTTSSSVASNDSALNVDEVTSSENSGVKSVKVLKVIKTAGAVDTAAEVLKALDDRNKKNAIQAKVNREKKKQYIKSLEDELSSLKTENGLLISQNAEIKRESQALADEVEYLRSVLRNESSLSKLLGNIENVESVKLKSSFVSRKRSADIDHDYSTKKRRVAEKKVSGGVCLHVDNNTVSLEFCSKCSRMAGSDEI